MGGLKYHTYGDDSDISESEIEEYAEISYNDLNNGIRKVETSGNAFSKTDVVVCYGTNKENIEAVDDSDEMFVWPWVGIIVNIPIGRSGPKLKDDLIASGFNPIKVNVIYDDDRGHSGTALVEFGATWSGFVHGLSFENAYEADHRGKQDWKVNNGQKSGLYCWIARADDYNSDNIIGENVRKHRDVKKLSDIIQDEKKKENKLVEKLANTVDTKSWQVKEMENKLKTTEISYRRVVAEYNKLRQYYDEELEKLHSTARDHFQRILNDHEKFKLLAELQKKELELRGKEMEQREAQIESEEKSYCKNFKR